MDGVQDILACVRLLAPQLEEKADSVFEAYIGLAEPFVDAEKFGMTRDELYIKMKEVNVLGRRYFYPLISDFSTYRGLDSARPENLPNAHKMANCVICLPMHHALTEEEIERIINVIKK